MSPGRVITDHTGVFENSSEELRPVLAEYAKLLKVNIYVSRAVDLDDYYLPRIGDGKLYIRFLSCPPGIPQAKYSSLEKAYGIPLRSIQKDACPPSDATPFVIIDPEGVSVAQVAGDTLYVLFDLPCHSENSGRLMRLIMEDYVRKFHDMSLQEKERRISESREQQFELSRRNFANLFLFQKRDFLEKLKLEIVEIEVDLERQQKEKSFLEKLGSHVVGAALRRERVGDLKARLKTLKEAEKKTKRDIKETAEEAEVLFGRLDEIAKANGSILRVSEDQIRLGIGQIDIRDIDGNKVYDIGEFELSIFPNGDSDGEYVRCFNSTRLVGDYHHPQVNTCGDCCLGNVTEAVEKMAQEGHWTHLVYTMVTFLKKGTEEGSWYLGPTHWPKRVKKRKGGGERKSSTS